MVFCLLSPFKSINANYLINEASYHKKKLRHQAAHMVKLNMDRQVCVIKIVAYRARTDRQTHARTDKRVKTEGPMIFLNDIFYFDGYQPSWCRKELATLLH